MTSPPNFHKLSTSPGKQSPRKQIKGLIIKRVKTIGGD